MKKYVEAMGGKLRIDVELPTGKTYRILCYSLITRTALC
jgi:hypothetical protein